MFTDSQEKAIIAGLDDITKIIATLKAKINPPETALKSPLHNDSVITSLLTNKMKLTELKEKFNVMMWKMLEIMGKEGTSRLTEINRRLGEQALISSDTYFRSMVKKLVKMRVLKEYKLCIPLISKYILLSLTDVGDRIFQDEFHEKPVESEMARVKRKYHSLEHGYEILLLEKVLINSGRYKEVNIFNRGSKDHAGVENSYSPDLMCVSADGKYIEYFEYDLGLISRSDLIKKCSKMRDVTTCLNLIVPQKNILIKRVLPKVEEMIKEYGQGILRNTIIRITTPLRLFKNNADRNSWWIVYNTKKSLNHPVVNRLQ